MGNKKSLSLYIHIPFCKKKCNYCAFYSTIWQSNLEKDYLNSLKKEIDCYKKIFQDYQISTLYFGGGTPSCLQPNTLAELLEYLKEAQRHKGTEAQSEISFELNPESVSKELLQVLKNFGFNRLSLGVQSMIDAELTKLGRIHNVADVYKAIKLIKEAGFTNFNLDYIFGLPGATIESSLYSLDKLLSFEPTHISYYSLTIESPSVFYKNHQKTVTDDQFIKIFNAIKKYLKAHGFIHYEVSAFAKKGFFAEHNLNYWLGKDYIGLGPGAHSRFLNKVFHNSPNLKKYFIDPTPAIFKRKIKEMTKKEQLTTYLITRLRLNKPISINKINQKFKIDFMQIFGPKLQILKNLRLLNIATKNYRNKNSVKLPSNNSVPLFLCAFDTFIKLTPKGFYLQDSVLEKLIY